MSRPRPGRGTLVRLAIGVTISVVLLAVTLAGVDLPATGAAIANAAPAGLAIAVAVVVIDLGLRALRWHVLLGDVPGEGPPPGYRLAFAYISIGYVANSVLPARLGDLARVYLAGGAFQMSRLALFGTLVIERVSDGLTMLALAALSGLVVAASSELRELVLVGAVLAAGGAAAAISVWLAIARTRIGSTRLGGVIGGLLDRVAAGAGALRSPRTAATVIGLTLAVAGTSTVVAWSVATSVGVELSPVEAVLFLSGVALSLAIPAGPAAIGTFEFVGVSIMTGLGHTPELGLATVLLLRLVTALPPVVAGLISVWALHIRPRSLVGPALADADR